MRDSDFLYKAAITRLNRSTRDMREGPAPYRRSRLWGDEPDRRAESLPVSAEKLTKPGGRRRSPRLVRVVEVEIAGRGAAGKVLVESTSTRNISRHGASLTARTPFPRSAPLAIRRSGGKPALARVVSVKSCSRPGLQQLGVGFVEDESYWEHEFPPDWQDNDGPAVEDEKPAEEPAAAHQRVHALDESLERVLRKGETLRAQAETMLREFAEQMEAAQRQGASALATELDLLAAQKNIAREELAEQARTAAEAIRAQEERAGASLVRQAAGTEEALQNLSRQFEATIQAALEKYQQILAQEGRKGGEIVAQVAASLEAQRNGVAELEEQSARWREQMGTGLNGLLQYTERLIHRSREEMQAASLASVQEFRKLTPQLVEEASRSFDAEILEKGRAALRTNLDLLRTRTEENQMQIERFAAEQEASLKSRTLELEQKLHATAMAQESALQERAAGPLESLRNAFCAAAAQARQTFSQALAAELEKAAPRVSELASTLDRHAKGRGRKPKEKAKR